MNRKRFRRTISIIVSLYFFVLGLIAIFAMDDAFYHKLGIASLIAAAVAFIVSIFQIKDMTAGRFFKTIITIAISCILISAGYIVLFKVNLFFGLSIVLAGYISCAFIGPVAKGFRDDRVERN